MNNKSLPAEGEPHRALTSQKDGITIRRLARTTVLGILGLAVCLLAKPATASLDHPATRPFMIVEGHVTIVVDPVTGAYDFTDWGWATDIGHYSNSGSGLLDLATGEFLTGSGVVIAANGDTIDWVVGAPNTVVDISGTGRFMGISGGFVVHVNSETLLSSNPGGTVTLAITYDGNGTLTY